jgi:transglutaminase-like putative cysteine protease
MAQRTAAAVAAGEVDLARYLEPTWFLDCDSPPVAAYARAAAGEAGGDVERACRLYYAVRDDIRYDPYGIDTSREGMRASRCLERRRGFCITKAALLAACARAIGLPARLGYGDVRNHLATEKLLATMGTDLFVYHGYTELLIDGVWVKATPAFNRELCTRFGVRTLEFDGRTDSLFHPFDVAGRKHMEYVRQRGHYPDLPYEEILATWRDTYPAPAVDTGFAMNGADFHDDAAAGR